MIEENQIDVLAEIRDAIDRIPLDALGNNLTLRDRFAMAALTGLLAAEKDMGEAEAARVAYEMADAMLAARQPAGEARP